MHVNHLFDRKLDLVTVLGFQLSLSIVDIVKILADRGALVFIGLVLVALAVADPFDVHPNLPPLMLLLFWPLALATHIALSLITMTAFSGLKGWFPNLPLPLPVKSAIVTLPSVILAETLAHVLTGSMHEFDVPRRLLLFYLLIQVFETVFYRFVVPQTAAYRAICAEPSTAASESVEAPSETTAPATQHHIIIGPEKVPVSHVRHIEAREHHVCVTLDGASFTHRARLSDIIAQTRPEDGFQTHRSWWVSKRVARTLERDGDRHVLKLQDNTVVPVARTRLPEVQAWIARHLGDGLTGT